MSQDLAQRQIDDIRAAFAVFDKNGDGQISAQELGEVMRSLGQNPTESELQDMVNELDLDSTGTVDFEEFLKMMKTKSKQMDSDEELREAFAAFDKDGSGTINAEEVRHVMKGIGENLTDGEIDEIIKQADTNGDGLIDYNEFVKFTKQG
ncbi:uncharacterized protein K452DRAFT_312287 [Aplosporella prunicola CBS 121167]|uniref:Calmodulin n=1 Tax=Aplosporella prunicola CBS 121167 TaxID=1176127 RepID=A0A6A6B2L7_9PEZI|nr:uncharacterized protein K452DRAFT_312287 [Aplosporella prunicola CBS 121167]KAF2137464.1 hypothetical protein K452DRAFT_312287 [Aplosporella prunicola CBS 121167]